MLLSIDWDAFSGTRELVFDAPIWGTPDREHDRIQAWRERLLKRGGAAWEALDEDFPLYPGWENLTRYAGVPAYVTLSHADAWTWLEHCIEQFGPGQDVLNIDSHHDLASFSGDPTRLRPGNWAGLGLQAGLIRHYTCLYPPWHADLPVAEGYDLERTRSELTPLLPDDVLRRVTLAPLLDWPGPAQVQGMLLVQSPAWVNPAHDPIFFKLAHEMACTPIRPPIQRYFSQTLAGTSGDSELL